MWHLYSCNIWIRPFSQSQKGKNKKIIEHLEPRKIKFSIQSRNVKSTLIDYFRPEKSIIVKIEERLFHPKSLEEAFSEINVWNKFTMNRFLIELADNSEKCFAPEKRLVVTDVAPRPLVQNINMVWLNQQRWTILIFLGYWPTVAEHYKVYFPNPIEYLSSLAPN